MTDLHLSNLSTLVPEAPYYAFYETRRQVYCGFDTDDMAFSRTLIWYHTRKQIHTAHIGAKRLTHKYILTTPLMCSQQLSALNESLTDIRNLLYRDSQYLCFSKITDLQKSAICWLDSVRIVTSCETQRIFIEIV